MGIIKKGDSYRFYKYKVKEIYILFSGESVKMDANRMNSLTIIDDYINNLYPIIKFDLALESELYYKIQKNKNDVKIKIRIQKFYRVGTGKEKSLASDYINDVFSLILDDDADDLAEKIRKESYPNGEKGKMNAVTTNMEFFLFKSDLIYGNRQSVNKVFTNCTITPVIRWLLQKGGSKKLLMTRADNQTVYPEIIIPPMSIVENILNADSFYGIHSNGSIIYFGIDRSYILKFYTQSNTFTTNEKHTVCIIVPRKGSSETDNVSEVYKPKDTDKIYILSDPESFDSKNRDITDSALSAKDIGIVSAESGTVENVGEKNKDILVKPGLNPYYESIYSCKKKSNETVISISFQDMDVSCLTPNKNYQFIFEDTTLSKKYKGFYMLCSTSISLVKEGKEFTAGVNAVFRKIV